ncbi:MAG: secretion activator protein [Thaumarchaeota archaeon]|nr:secretion activator protein [Nitrososphaerota archaeon]
MADFNIAVDITLDSAHEGGYQCNPNDRGNWTSGVIGEGELKGTNHGISAMEFPTLDIRNLTVEQATDIYSHKYWNPLYVDITDQFVANKLFDMGVLQGIGTAVKILQGVLAPQFGISVDGGFGSKTLDAVNKAEPISLLVSYKTALVAHVIQIGAKNPAERAFVGDYIRRINS